MATKTKTAKPKAKAKPKSKPKPKPNPKASPSSDANLGWIPTVGQTTTVENVAPENVVEQAFVLPRAKRADFGVREAAGMLRLLADPTRIAIVSLLLESPGTTVGDIVKNCTVSQPATSHHLSLLRHSGLAYTDRDGKCNRYSLTERGQIAAGLLVRLMEQGA